MTQPPLDFILEHKVFRLEEFLAGRKAATAREALKYHQASSRIARVRRGVYAHNEWIDPWFVASMLAKPAIVSHLGAMSFHFPDFIGVGHSLTFMTTERISVGRHNEIIFQPIRVEQSRLDWAQEEEHTREGQPVFVTSIAATLVDCLADLDRSPPISDLMLAFMVARKRKVKARAMIDHALGYESPLLCSRLGICLTCADFFPEDDQRGRLQKASLKRIAHFRRTKAKPKTDRSFPPWNIIVPSELYAFVRAP